MTPASPTSFVRNTQPDPGSPAQLAEWIEQSALVDLFAAAPLALRARAGLFVERVRGSLGFGAPGIPSALVNRVFVGGMGAAPDVAELSALLQRFEARGVRDTFAHVHADQLAPDVLGTLEVAGLARYPRAWVKLACEPSTALDVRPPLRLDPCAESDAEAFAQLTSEVFGLVPEMAELLVALVQRPRWHVYVATDCGQVVAAGALYVQGELGWLGFGATAPAYRRRGLQRALLARRLRVARALGCRLVASETGVPVRGQANPSQDNMLALGMRSLGVRENFARPGVVFR